jgi:hypothetical protein
MSIFIIIEAGINVNFKYLFLINSINMQVITLGSPTGLYASTITWFVILFIFNVVYRFFEIFNKKEINILLIKFYFIFQIFLLIITMWFIEFTYPIYKNIYFNLINSINVQLMSLKSDFIIFYTSTIFILLILTIIIISIDLIYSLITKKISFFNTKYNILFILSLTIFGIIGIIYSFLINKLGYMNFIHLTDAYLISIYLSIYLLVLTIALTKIDFSTSAQLIDSKFLNIKYIKEKVRKRGAMIFPPISMFILLFGIHSYVFLINGLIPWYTIILLIFYLYVTFEIFRRKLYFFKEETIYQDFYKINKYFNKRLLIVFGILAFVAIFDMLNFLLLRSYTIQNIIQPILIYEEIVSIMNQDLLLRASVFFSFAYLLYFLVYYVIYYYVNYPIYKDYIHYILAANIGYKVEKKESKEIQVNPIMTIFSYLALLILFIINLLL